MLLQIFQLFLLLVLAVVVSFPLSFNQTIYLFDLHSNQKSKIQNRFEKKKNFINR